MSQSHQSIRDRPASAPALDALHARTLKLSIVEGCAWAVMSGFGEQFVGPFAVFLKADDFSMSLLVTLPLILGALAQLAGGYLVEHMGQRRSVIIMTALIQGLGYLPLFWLPYLFPAQGARIAISVAIVMLISVHLGIPSFNSLMGDLIPEQIRGQFFSKRMSLITMAMLVSMLGAGRIATYFEHQHHVWLGFCVIFTIAMLARCCSAFMLTRYYEPPFRPSTGASFTFIDFIRETPRTNFGRFTFVMAIMNCMTSVSSPFFTQYMIRDLHWTKDQFAAITSAFLLSQIIFVRWWGRICDRHGNRSVIRATSLLLPLMPILWATTHNFTIILGVQVLSGMAWSGFNLACTNFIYDSTPANSRHRIFGYYNVINGMFVLVGGSVLGAWFAANMPSTFRIGDLTLVFLSSLPVVFILSGLLRALVSIILIPVFKEVRSTEPITSRQLLWRLSTGEP
ncbi:MAG: MFS transporter, partial [bacterium]